MINETSITAWSVNAPWSTRQQVEQDLLLSVVMIEIAKNDYLGSELIFRGGTCLHKLHFPRAYRYSEDLDYVRVSHDGIRMATRELTKIGEKLGFDVATRPNEHPKVDFSTQATDGGKLKIKIEINTRDSNFALPLERKNHTVDSEWLRGSQEILTFHPAELMATKIRALYQRNKGRDLFDFWLALEQLKLQPDEIVDAFYPYRGNITARLAEQNLRAKLNDRNFREDLNLLVQSWPPDYDVDSAAEQIIKSILRKI
jgi:predicted nucleotidyltransferase component of viral defense system